MPESARRVLILGLDGFRPDLFDPGQTPNLANLIATGTTFANHRSVYPPHTQSAVASLATGCEPGRHGLMGNSIAVPGFNNGEAIDAADYRQLYALEASGQPVLLVPALGDYLAEAGGRVAAASSGNAGAGSYWARRDLSLTININTDYDRDDVRQLRDRLGPIPEKRLDQPDELTHYITRAVTDLFLPEAQGIPVVVLWINEPDSSYHGFGIGSPESDHAMRVADECIGLVLEALDRLGQRDQFDILVMSDHGQTSMAKPASLADFLVESERDLGPWIRSLVTVADGIYLKSGEARPSAENLSRLVAWLGARPEIDRVFATAIDGVVPAGAASLESLWSGMTNPRAPLIAVNPVVTDDLNDFGVPGMAQYSTIKTGMRTSHGSLSDYDMNAFLIASGPSFARGSVHAEPTSVVDVLPTILEILGLPLPNHLDGSSLLR